MEGRDWSKYNIIYEYVFIYLVMMPTTIFPTPSTSSIIYDTERKKRYSSHDNNTVV